MFYSESSIKLNLTEERPQWKLSVYGPAKEEPNLIVGTDKSCEEDRLSYYMSMTAVGTESQYASIYFIINFVCFILNFFFYNLAC